MPEPKHGDRLSSSLNRSIVGLMAKYPDLAPLLRTLNAPKGRLGVLVAVLAIVASSFYTSYLRTIDNGMQHDLERVSDLQQISLAIQDFYIENNTLPDTLKGLEDRPNPNYVRDGYLYDSENQHMYEYRVLDPQSYQLCAGFHFATARIAHAMPSDVFNPVWDHDAGHTCFKTTVKSAAPKIDVLRQ